MISTNRGFYANNSNLQFPSRNRGAFEVKDGLERSQQKMRRCFHLVIEGLLISINNNLTHPERYWLFPSRNRGAFDFKHLRTSMKPSNSRFHLVIEGLLISTKRTAISLSNSLSFHLVIEGLLRARQQTSQQTEPSYYHFHLVIEGLLRARQTL